MSALFPAFNPHGGSTTHNSTGLKPDSPAHPVPSVTPHAWLRRSFTSHVPTNLVYDAIFFSCCSRSLSHSDPSNERLPIRLKLLTAPSYFALVVFLGF